MGKKIELSVVDLTERDGDKGILWRGEFYPQVEVVSCYRTVNMISGLSPQEYVDWIRHDAYLVREKVKERCHGGDEGVVQPITVIPKPDGYVIRTLIVPLPEGFDLEEFRNQKLS
jgi:hypothetical protein